MGFFQIDGLNLLYSICLRKGMLITLIFTAVSCYYYYSISVQLLTLDCKNG